MLKILQARLQQYMNCELPDGQAGFGKGRELSGVDQAKRLFESYLALFLSLLNFLVYRFFLPQ